MVFLCVLWCVLLCSYQCLCDDVFVCISVCVWVWVCLSVRLSVFVSVCECICQCVWVCLSVFSVCEYVCQCVCECVCQCSVCVSMFDSVCECVCQCVCQCVWVCVTVASLLLAFPPTIHSVVIWSYRSTKLRYSGPIINFIMINKNVEILYTLMAYGHPKSLAGYPIWFYECSLGIHWITAVRVLQNSFIGQYGLICFFLWSYKEISDCGQSQFILLSDFFFMLLDMAQMKHPIENRIQIRIYRVILQIIYAERH